MEQQTPVTEMTDREIAEETLTHLRNFAEGLNMLAQHPMLAGMLPQNGKAASPLDALFKG